MYLRNSLMCVQFVKIVHLFICLLASLVTQLVKNPPAMQETWV